ncbi:MAG: hypothetical protein HYX72_00835 [Acidobacteria bacterium]|nr:hypothetical protein [Acidobacteriota bacterium]
MPTAKPKSKRRTSAGVIPLCAYQERWIADKSRFKIAVKSRRIGFTFATTLEIALDAIERRTRWLVISRTQDTAREALKEIRNHFAAMRITSGCSEIADRPTELFFEGMRVNQFVIELPNGSEITAMSSHPDAARGFGGNVFLDEFGFHRDSSELWKGASAAVTRGHRLVVVSTPHYQTGKFFELARECGLVNMTHHRGHGEHREIGGKTSLSCASDSPACSAASVCSVVNSSLWSPHWVDIHTAAPQLRAIGVPVDMDELRQLAGDEETWKQEFCCEFLSAAEMWIPLELIAAARSPLASSEWRVGSGDELSGHSQLAIHQSQLFLGADIGRKRDRTAIWIDERVGEAAICRGVITLERTAFERQFEILSELIGDARVRRASIDQTGIGMALVERLQERFGSKVEGITFTNGIKEELSLRVRRRMENGLDKIPENAPEIERDFAAVKRAVTATGSLRFDAERTDAGHADIYWAKALADHAASDRAEAVCVGIDFSRQGISTREKQDWRESIWDRDNNFEDEAMFA